MLEHLNISLEDALSSAYGWSFEDPINPNNKKISGVEPEVVDDYFLHYKFESASELLSAVDIHTSDILRSKRGEEQHAFLYRGHQEHTWSLIPSFFRKFDVLDLYRGRFEAGRGQELQLFLHFLNSVNNLDVSIGDSDREIREVEYYAFGHKHGQYTGRNLFNEFPTKEQLPILGLAQHYGVPTRLLDVTTNPYKALFFASKGLYPFSDPDTDSPKRIGIWLFSELQIYVASLVSHIKRINVPKHQNANLIAQEGLFVNYIPPRKEKIFPYGVSNLLNEKEPKETLKPFNEVLVDVLRDQKWISINNISDQAIASLRSILFEVTGLPMLFSLPQAMSYDVNENLDQLNINWATMMPSLEGAAKEAQRRVRIKID